MLANIAVDTLLKFAFSLLLGEETFIGELMEGKLSAGSLAKDKLIEILKETPVGEAFSSSREVRERLARAFETSGASEYKRARDQWLNAVRNKFHARSSGLPGKMASNIEKIFNDALEEIQEQQQDQQGPASRAGYWKWSKSRQDWLNEDWRHDWRSQPRDLAGRWLPGRLSYIFVSHKQKKIRSARRRAIRKSVREMMRSGDG